MKFQSLYTADEFCKNLPEQIYAYNTTRELRHLRLKHIHTEDGSICIREGRRTKWLPAAEFKGKIVEEKGQTVLLGDVDRTHTPTPSEIFKFLFLNFIQLLFWMVIPYFICLGIAKLFETENTLIAIIVPIFTGFCIVYSFLRDWCYSKRRITRFLVSYMQCVVVEKAPLAVSKKQRRLLPIRKRIRHIFFWHFFLIPVWFFCRIVLNFRPTEKTVDPKRNYIMVANHVTDFDMLFLGLSMKKQMYFVMSEHMLRKGFASRLLSYGFAPIGRAKGSGAGSTIMNMLRYAKEGYNIAIFPEGFRTVSGRNNDFSPATGSLVKKMKIDLVTYRIKGGFYTQPCWSPHRRKGKCWGEFVGHYTADQLAKMTDKEVNDLIYRDIYEDADQTQSQHHITYLPKKGKGVAESIEYALMVCPVCHQMGKLHSKDDAFWCECGAKGKFTPECKIESDDFPYQGIVEWSYFTEEFVNNLSAEDPEQILLEAENQNLIEIDEVHHEDRCVVENGHFVQTPTYFAVNDRRFYYKDLAFFDIVRRGQLVFTTHDGNYYHVRGEVQLLGILVKMIYRHFCQK